MWDTLVTPDSGQAAAWRAAGWWRERTFLDDLDDHARTRPDHPAVLAYEGDALGRTLSYAQLRLYIERFASAFAELGVGRGDVVALYLPNRWMVTPLYLACHRLGAVASPVIPAYDVREFGTMLRDSGATVCVTVDHWQGTDYGARLAEAAPPGLEHRVVVGDAAATGAVDFDAFFLETPWEERRPVDPADRLGPDEPALLLFTSGTTTGRPKGVVHSQNTLHAAVLAVTGPHALTADDVVTIPHLVTHMAGLTYALYMPLFLGGTCVLQENNSDMGQLLDVVAAHGVTWLYAAPSFLPEILDVQREEPRDTSTLVHVVSGSAPVQPQLVGRIREVLGLPVRTLWGMTENGAVTVTRPDDPDDWGAHSDGRPEPFMEVRIDVEPGGDAGRLLVRGASQCLGYLGQREAYEACLDADGWFDTSDLARDDGRGGIRITGRSADRITRSSGLKVSTLALESVLVRHPAVKEVACVACPDPAMPVADLVCAVVVAEGRPPTLEELHEHLAAERVSRTLWPDRVQFVFALPKNSLGKVLREPLRERLRIEAEHAAPHWRAARAARAARS